MTTKTLKILDWSSVTEQRRRKKTAPVHFETQNKGKKEKDKEKTTHNGTQWEGLFIFYILIRMLWNGFFKERLKKSRVEISKTTKIYRNISLSSRWMTKMNWEKPVCMDKSNAPIMSLFCHFNWTVSVNAVAHTWKQTGNKRSRRYCASL